MTENPNAMTTVNPDAGLMSFGQTDLDAGDFILPRIKIVQAMSDEAQGQSAKVGDFWNTLTGENYGPAFSFAPIQPFKNRVFLTRPEKRIQYDKILREAKLPKLGEGDGLKCRSLDMQHGVGEPGIACGDCPFSQWDGADSPPLCTETYNVSAVTAEMGDLVVLSFSKSGAKEGKKLFTMMRVQTRGNPWAYTYEVSTSMKQNDKGRFAVPSVRKVGVSDPEVQQAALDWAQKLRGVVLDVTPIDEDEGGNGKAPVEEGKIEDAPFGN